MRGMRGTEIPGGFCEGYVIMNDIEHLSTHIYINILVLSLLNTIKIDFLRILPTHIAVPASQLSSL